MHHVLVQHPHATAGDGAHGQLRIRRHAELAHQHQVQAHGQFGGDFIGDRHPAARQGEDDDVGAAAVGLQQLRQGLAGGGTVDDGKFQAMYPGHLAALADVIRSQPAAAPPAPQARRE
ncbi:hypothetical protein D9M71_775780 [compost metagenome]